MRLLRIVHAIGDEATPRLARFVFRNHRGLPLPCPVSRWQDRQRPVVVNPDLAPPRPPARGFPRIIFQTWKSRSIIPDNYRYWRQTFVDRNPDHAVILWDDDDNRRFISEQFPWFLKTYDAYPAEIFRADAVRYFFLLHHGGLYADMDTECLRPVGDTLGSGDVVLCRMGRNRRFAHSVPNAVMASRPGQIFWLYVIRLMMEAAGSDGGPEEMTGPVLLKRAFDAFSRMDGAAAWAAVEPVRSRLHPDQRAMLDHGTITVLTPRAWYPLDWTNPVHKLLRKQLIRKRQLLSSEVARSLFPRSAVVTYWSHSW